MGTDIHLSAIVMCKVCFRFAEAIRYRGKWVCPFCSVPRPGQ